MSCMAGAGAEIVDLGEAGCLVAHGVGLRRGREQ